MTGMEFIHLQRNRGQGEIMINKKSVFIVLLFVIIALFLIFQHASFSQDVKDAQDVKDCVKLGDITTFSGEVLVKTKGVWSRLKTTPHIIYNTDKIVTRKGRAEITFIDGGVVRLDLDSNLSIAQRDETGGFMIRKKITARQVNLLVGDIWFDIKVKKEKLIRFRTPTMTAAIRGTSGKFNVNHTGNTTYGLATGKAETIGKYQKIVAPKPIVRSYIKAKNLPKSNPLIDNLPIQKKAIAIVKSFERSVFLDTEAERLNKIAESAVFEAKKLNTQAAKLHAKAMTAKAMATKSEAEAARAKALLESQQENLLEANRFGVVEEVAFATESVKDVSQNFEEAKRKADEDKQIALDIQNKLNKPIEESETKPKIEPKPKSKPKAKKEKKKSPKKAAPKVEEPKVEKPLEKDLFKEEKQDSSNVDQMDQKEDEIENKDEELSQKEDKKPKKPKKKVSWFQKIINLIRDKLNNWRMRFINWWNK